MMVLTIPCDDCVTVWENPYTGGCMDGCKRLKDFLKEREKA